MSKGEEIQVVCGGGGFIGGHLAADLLRLGFRVRVVDVRPLSQWQQVLPGAENLILDLSAKDACRIALRGAGTVYNLASDMGGMGFIERNRARCMLNVLINTSLLVAARDESIARYFFASSACVYNIDKQRRNEGVALRESDVYPAMPEDGYGWEKLFGERLCAHFREDFGLKTYVARFHNIYGPLGTWEGGREKAPAALCRKVCEAKLEGKGSVEIWGDGKQTRTFTYISDCIEGIHRLLQNDVAMPLNLGSSESTTIDELLTLVEGIAGVRLKRQYDLTAPRGVNGRSSDNSEIRARLGWEPSTRLRDGMKETYRWIENEILSRRARVEKRSA